MATFFYLQLMKVLIVEDEVELSKAIQTYLKSEGYVVECALTFDAAQEKVFVYKYDCIVLDINLPDGNGLKLLQEIKRAGIITSVIIVSANNTIDDKIKGLQIGADDYLTKPFHLSELNARIQAVIRRNVIQGSNVIVANEIEVLPDAKSANVNGKNITLTKKEYLLLEFFTMNQNKVLTKESISEHLWGDYMDQSDSFDFIYSHLKNLRKKLVVAGAEDYIKTVYGSGYIFKTA